MARGTLDYGFALALGGFPPGCPGALLRFGFNIFERRVGHVS
jgi:hypothetical protein